MNLKISATVKDKLQKKHGVTEEEILQCIRNRKGKSFLDTREKHATKPPTEWFIAETDTQRKLKIVFIFHKTTEQFEIKTAYAPNQTEINIYDRLCQNTK